jgi:hypothetical protein
VARYEPLTRFLQEQTHDVVRMSFGDIERVLGRKLPQSSGTHRAFWSNNAQNNVMTRAWIAAGFRSEQVDLPGQTLVFRRMKEAAMPGFKEAPLPLLGDADLVSGTPALFGWMKGTITIAPGVDLTEPAEPAWADLADEFDEPSS